MDKTNIRIKDYGQLYENSTYIDEVFYDLTISHDASQTTPGSLRGSGNLKLQNKKMLLSKNHFRLKLSDDRIFKILFTNQDMQTLVLDFIIISND